MRNDELLEYMRERFDNQDKKIEAFVKSQDEKLSDLIEIVKPIAEWKLKVQGTLDAIRYLLGGGSILGVLSLIWFIFKLLTGK